MDNPEDYVTCAECNEQIQWEGCHYDEENDLNFCDQVCNDAYIERSVEHEQLRNECEGRNLPANYIK
jgi:hypothetical protein